jgi:hypothetical protein
MAARAEGLAGSFHQVREDCVTGARSGLEEVGAGLELFYTAGVWLV